jgi:hypothetical protein
MAILLLGTSAAAYSQAGITITERIPPEKAYHRVPPGSRLRAGAGVFPNLHLKYPFHLESKEFRFAKFLIKLMEKYL